MWSCFIDGSIIGTWTASEWDDGAIETKTLTINQDGTGTQLKEEGDGDKKNKIIYLERSK